MQYHERETINLGGIWRNLKLVLYGPLKIKSGSTDNAITNIYMMPPSQCYFYIFLKDSANRHRPLRLRGHSNNT